MNQESQGKSNWIAVIGALAIVLAAIIGLGMPFAERLADRYLPTFTPVATSNTPTSPTETTVVVFAPTAIVQDQPKATATFQLPATSIGHRQIANSGSDDVILVSNQVAIGTADKFQDLLQYDNPPFTIFVIYGEVSTKLSIYWGGWDLWENASESFIDEQINDKIQEVISSHPTDYDIRGYRVIKCFGAIENCRIYLGNGYSSGPTFLSTPIGMTVIFTHTPPSSTIKYDSIAVDDELKKVELVCIDGTTDITSYFAPFTVDNEELLHYQSSSIKLRQGCRIDFTVDDKKGVKIGMQIKLSAP